MDPKWWIVPVQTGSGRSYAGRSGIVVSMHAVTPSATRKTLSRGLPPNTGYECVGRQRGVVRK
jgi:hypothetical protein